MKIKNFILIITYFILLLLISLFNFIQDPYNIFAKNDYFEMNTLLNNPYLQIKLSRKYKYKYVLAGGSSVRTLNIAKNKNDIADISVYNNADIYDMENLLFFWLKLHPETKTVLIPIDLYQLTFINKFHSKDYKTHHLTIKDIYTLFFAMETTKHSIRKFLSNKMIYNQNTLNNFVYQKEANIKTQEYLKIKPKFFKQNAQEYYQRIFSELKKRDIEVICFTVPVSANYQLEKYLIYDDRIDYVLKMIVEQTNILYNFWTINKFTKAPFIKEKNPYFTDKVHPNHIYGDKVINILFDTSLKDENLYVILTKDSIENELKKWKKDLKYWKKLHYNEIINQKETY